MSSLPSTSRPTPTTLIARWPTANAQSTVPILARTITANLSGIGTGRRAVQIRPFRMPLKGSLTRNMWVVRSLGLEEKLFVWVEDQEQSSRRAEMNKMRDKVREAKAKGKEKAHEIDQAVDQDLEDDEEQGALNGWEVSGHTSWTFSSLAVTSNSNASPSTPTPQASPFDAFLQRVLLSNSSSSSSGSSSSNSGATGQGLSSGGAQWTTRPTAVSLDGFTFSVGVNTGVAGGDWEIKVLTIGAKGGANAGSSHGVIVEITYLPVPYLPPNSSFIRDFASLLFPLQALSIGEIEWYEPDHELMFEAGLVSPKEERVGWEWKDKHSAFAYLQMFRKEGMI